METQEYAVDGTFITAEMVDQIDEADYEYYTLPDECKPPEIAYSFVPNDQVKFFTPYNKGDWDRLVFPEDDEYLDYEEEGLEKFDEYCSKKGESLDSSLTKRRKLRFLQANHFKCKETLKNIQYHLEWRTKNVPLILSNDMSKTLVKEGMTYVFGRDRFFRPITVIRNKAIIEQKSSPEEAMEACNHVNLFVIQHMLIRGRVENFLVISDLENVNYSKYPKKWGKLLVKENQKNILCRVFRFFLLSASFGFRALWRVLSPFVDYKIQNKIIMVKDMDCTELKTIVHPDQLQKCHGGNAKNQKVFWPPTVPNQEFDHFEEMIE